MLHLATPWMLSISTPKPNQEIEGRSKCRPNRQQSHCLVRVVEQQLEMRLRFACYLPTIPESLRLTVDLEAILVGPDSQVEAQRQEEIASAVAVHPSHAFQCTSP